MPPHRRCESHDCRSATSITAALPPSHNIPHAPPPLTHHTPPHPTPPSHHAQNLGTDWDERVLPSIGNEVVKAVVAQYQVGGGVGVLLLPTGWRGGRGAVRVQCRAEAILLLTLLLPCAALRSLWRHGPPPPPAPSHRIAAAAVPDADAAGGAAADAARPGVGGGARVADEAGQ